MDHSSALQEPQLNRRSFVASLGLLGAAAGLAPVARAASPTASPEVGSAAGLMKCRPYLQAPQPGEITVRWITTTRCHSWVEFGEEADKLTRKARQVEDGLAQADNTIHAVTLTGLQPGRTYHYRVVSQAVHNLARKQAAFGPAETSEVYSFRTTPERAEKIEFIVFNDIHDRPESFRHLMQFNDGAAKDFVFLNGDMFNFEESENQIVDHLLNPLTELFATRTPFYFGRGNHETWGNFSRQLRDYFDGRGQKFYYGLPCGPMYGIVLDTGESRADDDPVHGGIHAFDAYREAQARWLAEEVQKPAFKAAKFRVVFVHIPPFYMQDVHATVHSRELWGPILNDAKIDLMLCGHTHRHGIHPPVAGKHNFPIVIGGGPNDGKRTLIDVKVDATTLALTIKDDGGRPVRELRLPARA